MVLGGTSLVTTEPAATMELSPIVTPGKITLLPPIHTLLPMCMGIAYPLLSLTLFGYVDYHKAFSVLSTRLCQLSFGYLEVGSLRKGTNWLLW